MKEIFLLFSLAFCSVVSAHTYYVAPNGNDSNSGTFLQPWATWDKAFTSTAVQPGDTVYFRGGVYYKKTNGGYTMSKSGRVSDTIYFLNYAGEIPILDCSSIPKLTSNFNVGITFNRVSYIKAEGLTIRNVWQQDGNDEPTGFSVESSSNVVIKNCTVYNTHGRGFNSYQNNNLYYINCDSYNNCDSLTTVPENNRLPGNDGYGFIDINWAFNTGRVYYKNCRSWNNGDDGFAAGSDGYIEYYGCWSFANGQLQGGGSGFKMGWTQNVVAGVLHRLYKNCIAAYNRTVGWTTNDQGYKSGQLHVYNNTSYHNGYVEDWYQEANPSYGFLIWPTLDTDERELLRTYRNNIAYDNENGPTGPTYGNPLFTHDHNSWDSSPAVTITDADFVSVDSTGLTGARGADGSLPDLDFLKLASTSDAIDAGVDVGLSYKGDAPDLGYSEYLSGGSVTPSIPQYVNSAIENATPSRLEITYNLGLANIVPSGSAYTVIVNSVARNVNTISISGNEVLLTLANPIVYGDVVTVAYTKPSTNPLQTEAGGQATTISAQTVTNKVNPIASPVYVSSAIENATPSILEMVYNLSLAGIIPAASAFTVEVNSVIRTINTVAISGSKVILTLASAVVYGNVVTVAYTKPASNPLQTASGGQAVTINAQSVTNNLSFINTPPVVVVNFAPNNLSGFVGEIDATGSYDPNNDNLTYTWVVPYNIPVSSITGSKIQFLSPIVNTPQTIEFTLKISDGKTTLSKAIPVQILPYRPELEVAEVLSVEASGFQSPNYPHNILDGNIGTVWAVNGDNQWLILELKESFKIQHVKIAFQLGQRRESYFDLLGSDDKVTWEPILTKSTSCAFSGDIQVFDFPSSKSGKEFKYVKLVGHSNSVDNWNYISEFRIFGYKHRIPTSYEEQPVKIYPNPAHEFINIRIDETTLNPDFIRIINLSGKIVFQDKVNPDVKDFQIPINLIQGVYIVQMGSGKLTLFTQKLIVSN